nr:MAG: hypothetical protein [Planococcus ficus-associated tombus-like virus 1]
MTLRRLPRTLLPSCGRHYMIPQRHQNRWESCMLTTRSSLWAHGGNRRAHPPSTTYPSTCRPKLHQNYGTCRVIFMGFFWQFYSHDYTVPRGPLRH